MTMRINSEILTKMSVCHLQGCYDELLATFLNVDNFARMKEINIEISI